MQHLDLTATALFYLKFIEYQLIFMGSLFGPLVNHGSLVNLFIQARDDVPNMCLVGFKSSR